MLMNIDCSIVQSIKVALTFDDNQTKVREISVGDLAYFEFNKNGKRRIIEGKVIQIGASNTTDVKSWYIVVDGSLDFSGQMERFSPSQILDCDIIQKHDDVQYITTPNDSTRITDIRFYNGVLQISLDGGYSWITPKAVLPKPDKDHLLKPKKKKKKKPIVIEEDDPDDDDNGDEEYPDDDTYPDDSDDGDDDYPYDDGDDSDDDDDDDYGISPSRIYGEVY